MEGDIIMVNTLIDTVSYGTTTSLASSTSATVGESSENLYSAEILSDSVGTSYMGSVTSSTTIPTTAVTAVIGRGVNGYNTVQAVTYIESCSNEEVNDMLNQIDELLDENTNTSKDVKTLSKRI